MLTHISLSNHDEKATCYTVGKQYLAYYIMRAVLTCFIRALVDFSGCFSSGFENRRRDLPKINLLYEPSVSITSMQCLTSLVNFSKTSRIPARMFRIWKACLPIQNIVFLVSPSTTEPTLFSANASVSTRTNRQSTY